MIERERNETLSPRPPPPRARARARRKRSHNRRTHSLLSRATIFQVHNNHPLSTLMRCFKDVFQIKSYPETSVTTSAPRFTRLVPDEVLVQGPACKCHLSMLVGSPAIVRVVNLAGGATALSVG